MDQAKTVRIVSVSIEAEPAVLITYFDGKDIEAELTPLFEKHCADGVDLVVFPETLAGGEEPVGIPGPFLSFFQKKARQYHTYVVCPVFRKCPDGARANAAVLIDREGNIQAIYDKIFPFWAEFDLKPPVRAGSECLVAETDFGRLGFAICFDANFPELWQELADKDADIVVWTSAYSAFSSLQGHAKNHHYYIVTATMACDCTVYDINGELMHYSRGKGYHVTHTTLDMNRIICHENFNRDKIARLLKEHPGEAEMEADMQREGWIILKGLNPENPIRRLAGEYGIPELRQYVRASREMVQRHRDGR